VHRKHRKAKRVVGVVAVEFVYVEAAPLDEKASQTHKRKKEIGKQAVLGGKAKKKDAK
jgi:hypothetical protein